MPRKPLAPPLAVPDDLLPAVRQAWTSTPPGVRLDCGAVCLSVIQPDPGQPDWLEVAALLPTGAFWPGTWPRDDLDPATIWSLARQFQAGQGGDPAALFTDPWRSATAETEGAAAEAGALAVPGGGWRDDHPVSERR